MFHTTRTVLTQERGSMLECMFSGRFPLDLDEAGHCFVDRDPRHFPVILDYLRNGVAQVPANDPERSAVLREVCKTGVGPASPPPPPAARPLCKGQVAAGHFLVEKVFFI